MIADVCGWVKMSKNDQKWSCETLTNKAFTDAGKGRIRQSLTALVKYVFSIINFITNAYTGVSE